jgi:hypothetical protein
MSERNDDQTSPGGATGGIRTLLRLEGLALLLATLTGYALAGESWWLFALLFLAPDLTFFAFFAGKRAGVIAYNAAHTTIAPLALIAFGLVANSNTTIAVALIWAAHIGADRAIGYGLKYPQDFEMTHLGAIGKKKAT